MKKKFTSPYQDSNHSIIQPVAQRYTTELSRLFSGGGGGEKNPHIPVGNVPWPYNMLPFLLDAVQIFYGL
jgi:hypothetical protein